MLWWVWDPLGVNNDVIPREEYSRFVGPVYRMLIYGRTSEEIEEHLISVARAELGVTSHESGRVTATRLSDLRDYFQVLLAD